MWTPGPILFEKRTPKKAGICFVALFHEITRQTLLNLAEVVSIEVSFHNF